MWPKEVHLARHFGPISFAVGKGLQKDFFARIVGVGWLECEEACR